MSTPSAIVFDLGNVLLDFDYGLCVRKMLPFTARSENELRQVIGQSPLLYRLETGLISPEEFYAEVEAHCAFPNGFGFPQFEEIFSDIFRPIEPMILLQQSLRKSGYPTYLFSNTNAVAVRHIRQRYPFFEGFDGHILSYEHRAMKPDHRLYEVVEKVSGRRGPELLYIDDRPENIEAGLARGWHSILHQTQAQTEAELKERLKAEG